MKALMSFLEPCMTKRRKGGKNQEKYGDEGIAMIKPEKYVNRYVTIDIL